MVVREVGIGPRRRALLERDDVVPGRAERRCEHRRRQACSDGDDVDLVVADHRLVRSVPCDRQDDVILRDARVHCRHLRQALDAPLLRSVRQLVLGPGALGTGIADELPAGEVAVAAVDRDRRGSPRFVSSWSVEKKRVGAGLDEDPCEQLLLGGLRSSACFAFAAASAARGSRRSCCLRATAGGLGLAVSSAFKIASWSSSQSCCERALRSEPARTGRASEALAGTSAVASARLKAVARQVVVARPGSPWPHAPGAAGGEAQRAWRTAPRSTSASAKAGMRRASRRCT